MMPRRTAATRVDTDEMRRLACIGEAGTHAGALLEQAADALDRLLAALLAIKTMEPDQIVPGVVHGPQLPLGNCRRIPTKASGRSRKELSR